jgi:hypothetical protein|nr:MAG TPA: hypothetical protein [Caudoviricetes sp.]
MKKLLIGTLAVLFSTLAHAQFSTAVRQDQSGLDVFATNTDDKPHTCHISFRFTTENSPGGQSVSTQATAHPGIQNQVIHSTRGGWSQFSASNVSVQCN